jgi:transcriptional regulator with XRE-family HTH domain
MPGVQLAQVRAARVSDTSRQVLDIAALAAAIETVTRHRKISMKDVAAETGLSASTLTRLTQGQKPDADGLVTLLSWLNAEASAFAVDRRLSACLSTPESIADQQGTEFLSDGTPASEQVRPPVPNAPRY